MPSHRSLVCVHRVTSPIEANLIKGLLETEGIQVELTGEGLVGAYSGVPKVCDVRVLVPASLKSAADAVLRAYEDGRGAKAGPPWTCDDCGESNERHFEICWRCGHARGDE